MQLSLWLLSARLGSCWHGSDAVCVTAVPGRGASSRSSWSPCLKSVDRRLRAQIADRIRSLVDARGQKDLLRFALTSS